MNKIALYCIFACFTTPLFSMQEVNVTDNSKTVSKALSRARHATKQLNTYSFGGGFIFGFLANIYPYKSNNMALFGNIVGYLCTNAFYDVLRGQAEEGKYPEMENDSCIISFNSVGENRSLSVSPKQSLAGYCMGGVTAYGIKKLVPLAWTALKSIRR